MAKTKRRKLQLAAQTAVVNDCVIGDAWSSEHWHLMAVSHYLHSQLRGAGFINVCPCVEPELDICQLGEVIKKQCSIVGVVTLVHREYPLTIGSTAILQGGRTGIAR